MGVFVILDVNSINWTYLREVISRS
jgi:hypothetical protein